MDNGENSHSTITNRWKDILNKKPRSLPQINEKGEIIKNFSLYCVICKECKKDLQLEKDNAIMEIDYFEKFRLEGQISSPKSGHGCDLWVLELGGHGVTCEFFQIET